MTRKLSTPFAINSTLINQVPVSQTSDSQASYDIGFPSKNFQTIANGGVAVDGKDFNGILNDITGNIVDLNKGLPQYYDDAYATLIGGYPIGARLCLNDNSGYVVSTISNNSSNPNTSTTGWKYTDFQEYDFKTAQPLQYYYDKLGNWDDAIFQAQLNIYLKGYSSKLILPSSRITITRPILGGTSLGEAIYNFFQENGITNDFYDATNKKFNYVWNTNIQGAGQTQSYIEIARPTTLDKTYTDWGAIHVGLSAKSLQDYIKTKDESILKNWWKEEVILNGFTIEGSVSSLGSGVPDKANNYKPNCHGIVIAYLGSHHHNIQQVAVQNIWGSGMLIDHSFDSILQDNGIYNCGRMVGDYPSWCVENKKTDVQYQLYAPLQLSKMSGAGDNSNFMRFYDFHFEDNYDAVIDAIFSSSSPVWLNSWHLECESSGDSDVGGMNKKCAIWGSGGACASYLGQENVSGFDMENFEKLGAAGGTTVIKSRNITQYSECYTHGYIGSVYSQHYMEASSITGVSLVGNNDVAIFSLSKSSCGSIDASSIASNLAVSLDDVDVYGSISFNYTVQFSFKDVRSTGDFNIENTSAYTYPNSIDGDCYFNTVNGHLYNCFGRFSSTSTSSPNNLLITQGNVQVVSDAYRKSKVGF